MNSSTSNFQLYLLRMLAWALLLFGHNYGSAQSLKEVTASKDPSMIDAYIDQNGVDHCEGGSNLLIRLAGTGQIELMKYVLEKGANIDAICKDDRTPLMYTAILNQVEAAEFLLKNGADLGKEDAFGMSVIEVARFYRNFDIVDKVFAKYCGKYIAPDGPHIFYGDELSVYQLLEKTDGESAYQKSTIPSSDAFNGQEFHCFDRDGEKMFSFQLSSDVKEPSSSYKMPSKLVAVSDIEGEIEALVLLLKQSGVVDEELNWNYGAGHLVLTGDYFDRGSNVTECLWLIYKLEQEAEKAGGKVHFVLGNHELMNITGDLRYLSPKYLALNRILDVDYLSLYSNQAVLGRWLRSKNVMVRIGDLLFCHGGVSEEFASMRMPLKKINKTARQYLGKTKEEMANDLEAVYIFHEGAGPLWFRGNSGEKIPAETFNSILKLYKVETLIIGHTPVPSITSFYDGKLINIDVPHAKGPEHQQALLVEDGNFFVINGDGSKVALP